MEKCSLLCQYSYLLFMNEQYDTPLEKTNTGDNIRFAELPLHDAILKAVDQLGFAYCSPIQARALPYTLLGNDMVGKAQTGTGKTAAFLITILQDLLAHDIEEPRQIGEPRALIIAPTRELVLQIGEDAKALGKFANLRVITLVGGMPYDSQKELVDQKPVDIVVATPGRLLDFVSRRDMVLRWVEILVLDEADRMLDMGFIPQVRRIVRMTPPKENRQTLLFSATFPYIVNNLIEQWTFEPAKVDVLPEKVVAESINQVVYTVASYDKYKLLNNILHSDQVESVMIFVNRRDQCRQLFTQLKESGFKVVMISGEIDQSKRSQSLAKFKSGSVKILVATDVAGRGIHVDEVSHVVNYNLPDDPEDYVHRIGRTGRAGKTGISISFACEDDGFLIAPIESLLGSKLNCKLPPEHLLN